MKIRFFAPHIFIFLLLAFSPMVSVHAQLQCDNDTTGLKALIDLQTGYYLGYQGGLYPGGKNQMPYAHLSAGMNISRSIMPLDTNGMIDLEDGKMGFICLGASTAGNAFNHFKTVSEMDTTLNPCMKIANCAVGAKGLEIMIDTIANDWYWDDDIMGDVEGAGLNRRQVEVAWIMVTSRVDTVLIWPYQPQSVADKYEALMAIMLAKFPNLKEVFISGFYYGGYADPDKEFYDMIYEPSSYWNNWSVKFVVQRQIEADPDLKYTYPGRKSAWISWGPPVWADGMRANYKDGLRWNCLEDFNPDGGGYHLTNTGKDKIGELIYQFFKSSSVAADWYRYSLRWDACDPTPRLASAETPKPALGVFPQPLSDEGWYELKNIASGPVQVTICNALGHVISSVALEANDGYLTGPLSLPSQPPGMYFIIARTATESVTESFMIVR